MTDNDREYQTDLYKALEELKEPFSQSLVRWRVGNKSKDGEWLMLFAYLEPRDIMERLDEVCARHNLVWSSNDEYVFDDRGQIIKTTVKLEEPSAGITIERSDASRLTPVLIPDRLKSEDYRDRASANVSYSRDLENAVKGQVTDAFKRACVKIGIGRYLYMLGMSWVKNEGEDKYGNAKFTPPRLEPWALPENERGAAAEEKKPDSYTRERGSGPTQTGGEKKEAKPASKKQIDFLIDLSGQMAKYDAARAQHMGDRANDPKLTSAEAWKLNGEALEELKAHRAKNKDGGRDTDGQDHGAPPGSSPGDEPHGDPEPPPIDDDLPF